MTTPWNDVQVSPESRLWDGDLPKDVYWGVLSGSTPVGRVKETGLGSVKLKYNAVTVKASANFMRSSGTRKTLQTTNQKDILPNLTILKLIR